MKNILNIVRTKPVRELIFRAGFVLRKKTGELKRRFPIDVPFVQLMTLSEFKNCHQEFFFKDRETITLPKQPNLSLKHTASRILNGEMKFFSKEWINLGLNYDWVSNIVSGYNYSNTMHWSDLESLDESAGDIKYVWEKSRFSFLYPIIRYDYHFDEDHSNFVFTQILDWIDKNPVNCGPNYVCSQEISLRITNWLFALWFYKNSSELDERKWSKIINSIYWQLTHIYSNINFSRKAVRNNHAITETLTLYIFGLLFPSLPGANKWKKKGKKWFEQEIRYQFESDGSYIQESMNYQRVVTQLLTVGLSIAHLNGEYFSKDIYKNAYKSLNFLYQFLNNENGWLPNYGSNDGALFFQLTDSDYRDYRPQLDALHYVLTGQPLFKDRLEESLWYDRAVQHFPPLSQQEGLIEFGKSGYYLIRDTDTLTFIRCGNFKKKGTTDQLHIDIWYKDKNILFDGGSFRYNASKQELKYFAGTESHNTVMIDDYDQMLKGPRFMWFSPTRVKSIRIYETDSEYIFDGTVAMFRYLNKEITVQRKLIKKKKTHEWTVEDVISSLPEGKTFRQLWHSADENITFVSTGTKKETVGYYSDYYGIKEICKQVEFNTNGSKIKTKITL